MAKKRGKNAWLAGYQARSAARRIKVKLTLALDYLLDDADNRFYRREPGLITRELIFAAVHKKYPEGSKDRIVKGCIKEIIEGIKRSFQKSDPQPTTPGPDGKPLPPEIAPVQLVRKRDQVEMSKLALETVRDALEAWSVETALMPWVEDLLNHVLSVLKAAEAPLNGAEKLEPAAAKA